MAYSPVLFPMTNSKNPVVELPKAYDLKKFKINMPEYKDLLAIGALLWIGSNTEIQQSGLVGSTITNVTQYVRRS